MPKTAGRLNGFTESVIREMTRIAHRTGAINLSQGFPDKDPPRAVLDAAVAAINGGVHQYAVTWGAPNFRAALAEKQRRWMAQTIGVAAVPGSTFFREPVRHLIRLHFARSEATLEETGRRLAKISALL